MADMDILREMGVDVLAPFGPPSGADANLALAKKEIGDRICMWGRMNASVDLVSSESKKILRKQWKRVARPMGELF